MDCVCTFASAPGKLILFGEHAVVYGHPALAGALSDLRVPCRVRARNGAAGDLSLALPALAAGGAPLHFSWPLAALRSAVRDSLPVPGAAPAPPCAALRGALEALVAAAGASLEAHRRALLPALFLCVGVFAERLRAGAPAPLGGLAAEVLPPSLPVGAGLGSSAAVCAALSAALLDAEARLSAGGGAGGAPPPPQQLERVNAWAFAAETIFHGTPSGLDNTVATCVRLAVAPAAAGPPTAAPYGPSSSPPTTHASTRTHTHLYPPLLAGLAAR